MEIETYEGGEDIKELTVVEDVGVVGVDGSGLNGGVLGVVTLGCELDLRKQLIHNIRACSKVRLGLQEVVMGVRNAATLYIAGLTTSLLQWAGALPMRTTMTIMITRILRLLGKTWGNISQICMHEM